MASKKTLVQGLAEHAQKISYEKLSPEAINMLKGCILDTLGGIYAAWKTGELQNMMDTIESFAGSEEATFWMTGKKLPAHMTALGLACLDNFLEYSGSTSSVITSITMGDVYNRSGKDVLAGMCVADDIQEAVCMLFASEYEAHRLHWPAQTTCYSTAATASFMAGAGTEETERALSIAGCLSPIAPFEAFIQGAQSKVFYGGWPLMVGILAKRFAERGCSGPINLFEGTRGLGVCWYHHMLSEDRYQELIPTEVGYSLEGGHKYYASNLCAQPTLNCLQQMMEAHPEIKAENIESVDVLTYEYALALSQPSPAKTRISAHVNIPFLVAAMLTDGRVTQEQTDPSHLADEKLRALAEKVTLGLYSGADTDLKSRKARPSRVTVKLKNGKEFTHEVMGTRWTASEPPTNEEIEAKFRYMVGEQIPETKLNKIIDMIWHIEELPSIRNLIALMPVRS